MAIEKYTTEAIILDVYDQGEHDRVYKVFTKDFGLIMCHAKSIRKIESKLRAHILPRTISLLTLVKGREIWRLVGAEGKTFPMQHIDEVTELLKRFVRGEGVHKSLYARVRAIVLDTSLRESRMSRLLIYYVILVELGYADAEAIGAKDVKEYASFSVDDLYTHLLLSYNAVSKHVVLVLKEMQL